MLKTGGINLVGESITMRFQVFPNPMHDHQRIACGPIAELLQEFIKDVVVSADTVVGIGEKVFEQARSLGQQINSIA
jgi:predicted house-cleaning NTP pyrophosphatase (Maf/HAM1 superfamily)